MRIAWNKGLKGIYKLSEWDIDNGITLCNKCHDKTKKREE